MTNNTENLGIFSTLRRHGIDASDIVNNKGQQSIEGTLSVNNTDNHSTIALTPSNGGFAGTIAITDGQGKNISMSPGVISSVFVAPNTTVRNTLTYTLSSNNTTNELSILALDTDTMTLVGEVVLGPDKVALKGQGDTDYTTLTSSSGHAVFDKVVEAVTPTDATNKKQLVTIEYLESVLQNI